ncbi:hypothetical protein BDB01DRAFT_773384 [Pilobolus umbonatus]|nr:hypothetical protein BDB01DRAFT_773384 [Pilobolus umbonatus]
MSLLLTKTCEYVLIIVLEEGRYFDTDTYSIRVNAELDLKLPPTIDDLLPMKTTISTESTKIENGHCSFITPPLAYFISHKQFRRLRKTDAKITLTLYKNTEDSPISSLLFPIYEAKEVIKKQEHKMDIIYQFVSDKGAWMTLPKRKEQIKVGFYYVSMHDYKKNDTNKNRATHSNTNTNTSCSSDSSNNSQNMNSINMTSIVLRSPPPTPTVQKRLTSNNRKKVSSILGTNSLNCISFNSNNNSSNHNNNNNNKNIFSSKNINTKNITSNSKNIALNNKNTVNKTTSKNGSLSNRSSVNAKKKDEGRLRRTKSSLVDLNIEEIADILKKIKIFSAKEDETKIPLPYHQIGKGSSQFTFYFKVVHGDQIKSSLLRSSPTSRLTKQPHFGYSFLTNYNYLPASSFSQKDRMKPSVRTCYQLRGHLVDIQNWLDRQETIDISLILVDLNTKITAGKCPIPLRGIAFDYHTPNQKKIFSERTYGIHSIEDSTEIGKVLVRIGLVSGWHADTEYEYFDEVDSSLSSQKRRNMTIPNDIDPWDIMFHDKKMRHHSQSSVPTLLTSSTTTVSSKSSNYIPSIQLITPNQRKKDQNYYYSNKRRME